MLTRTLLTRSLLLRAVKKNADTIKQTRRNAGHGVWSYRVPPPMPSRSAILLAEGLGAFAWWWVFWHLLTEPEHVFGEWPYIDPSTWTDEELGIPPDSRGTLKVLKHLE